MRFKSFLNEGKCPPGFVWSSQNGKCMPEGREFGQGILTTEDELTKQHSFVTKDQAQDFISRWKSKLKSFGVTEVEFSTHFIVDRLNDKRNSPPISIDELDFIMNGFIKKMSSQFKKDVENVKNHTAKKRGFNKKNLNDNEIEYTVSSNSNKINFAFVLKQNFKKKSTAVILPITIIRKKNFKLKQGEQVIVERRVLCQVH